MVELGWCINRFVTVSTIVRIAYKFFIVVTRRPIPHLFIRGMQCTLLKSGFYISQAYYDLSQCSCSSLAPWEANPTIDASKLQPANGRHQSHTSLITELHGRPRDAETGRAQNAITD